MMMMLQIGRLSIKISRKIARSLARTLTEHTSNSSVGCRVSPIVVVVLVVLVVVGEVDAGAARRGAERRWSCWWLEAEVDGCLRSAWVERLTPQ